MIVSINNFDGNAQALSALLNSTPILIGLVLPNGDSICLDRRDNHFGGYKPGNVISVFYLEEEDDDSAMVVETEYFSPDNIDKAVQAAIIRFNTNGSFIGSLSQSLDDILEKD